MPVEAWVVSGGVILAGVAGAIWSAPQSNRRDAYYQKQIGSAHDLHRRSKSHGRSQSQPVSSPHTPRRTGPGALDETRRSPRRDIMKRRSRVCARTILTIAALATATAMTVSAQEAKDQAIADLVGEWQISYTNGAGPALLHRRQGLVSFEREKMKGRVIRKSERSCSSSRAMLGSSG